jgi:hypothetical protein
MKGMKKVAADRSRGERIAHETGLASARPRIADPKQGLMEMQAADQAERVVGAPARRHRSSIHEGSGEGGS